MDPEHLRVFARLAQVAQALPESPAPPAALQVVNPPGLVRCACNQKWISWDEVRVLDSAHVRGITDSLCRECLRNGLEKHALIACIRCKTVVSRLAPGRFKGGFRILPGAVYHTNACPNCQSDLAVSFLIEKRVFDSANGFNH